VQPSSVEILAAVLFGLALCHTFSVQRFQRLAARCVPGSVAENLWHLLGEVEVVFGLWAAFLALGIVALEGRDASAAFLKGRDFTEPAFVFVIMAVAATRPILDLASALIGGAARVLPAPREVAFFIAALVLGPLLGSFITEPAAMTVTAMVLKRRYYDRGISDRLKYATLGVLFVNVSIGGTLTPFAAPPVLMVAEKWGFGIGEMLWLFGWKAALAVAINAIAVALLFRRELGRLPALESASSDPRGRSPLWLVAIHLVFLAGIVMGSHHPVVFMGLFLFFLGLAQVTQEHQDELKLKESLLVGFFLAGLVVLGGLQRWWLEPVVSALDSSGLFVGTTALTAITDNAALTYLGSQVPGLSEASRQALVAGAVAGGGLTVIANAPNPAGFGILRSSFTDAAVSPLGLLLAALGPTLVAMGCLWLLPNL
jgi:Na+/H+ antiporter NhaD/arsenite permease-like protein